MNTPFEKGALVFSLAGHAGRYHAAVEGVGHLVAPIWESSYGEGDEGPYEHEGDPTLWKECFATEPTPKLGPEIAAQQKRLEELGVKISEARTSLEEATRLARVNAAMQTKLAGQNTVFTRADLLFDGKINFVVSRDWYGKVMVMGKDEKESVCQSEQDRLRYATDFKSYPLRLLSLWGKRDGTTGWHLHNYSDGSSNGGYAVEVFETREEAVEFAKSQVLELIAKKRKENSNDPSRVATQAHWDSLKAIGFGDLYPDDLKEYLTNSAKRQKDEAFVRLEKEYLAAKEARKVKEPV